MDEQRSQVRIASQADAHQPALAAAGVLPGDQAQPGRKLSPIGKGPSVADGGYDRRRCQWAYAFDGPDALAVFVALKGQLDLMVRSVDPHLQLDELFIEAAEELTAETGELVFGIFQHGW